MGSLETPVTITFFPSQIITWLLIGLIAGYLAGLLVRGRRFGLGTSIVVGLIGGLVGGLLFKALNLETRVPAFLLESLSFRYIDILVAFVGAVIFLIVLMLVFRWRR